MVSEKPCILYSDRIAGWVRSTNLTKRGKSWHLPYLPWRVSWLCAFQPYDLGLLAKDLRIV